MRTASGCDRLGSLDHFTIQFRDAVDELAKKLGRFVPMAVPALVVGCVIEPEVGTEIDQGDAAPEDCRSKCLTMPVWQRCKHEIDVVEGARTEPVNDGFWVSRREMRVNRTELLSGLAIAEHPRCAQFRVRSDEPQQLAADIA